MNTANAALIAHGDEEDHAGQVSAPWTPEKTSYLHAFLASKSFHLHEVYDVFGNISISSATLSKIAKCTAVHSNYTAICKRAYEWKRKASEEALSTLVVENEAVEGAKV